MVSRLHVQRLPCLLTLPDVLRLFVLANTTSYFQNHNRVCRVKSHSPSPPYINFFSLSPLQTLDTDYFIYSSKVSRLRLCSINSAHEFCRGVGRSYLLLITCRVLRFYAKCFSRIESRILRQFRLIFQLTSAE